MTRRSFSLERVDVPQWVGRMSDTDARDRLGEQAEWAFAIPWIFQALAAPNRPTPFVRRPEPSDDQWPLALGYWTPLLHLLVYGFGWSRPDKGLLWWIDNDRPTDDPKLALIDQLWHTDGQLDWFVAWLWTTGSRNYLGDFHDEIVGPALRPDQMWLDQIERHIESTQTPAPFGGGTDPLHLAAHVRDPLDARPPYGPGRLHYDQTGKRQATLVLDSMTGWYRALAETAAHLATRPGRAWAIDVVVTTVGHLGTYRCSRSTGLWYSGLHRHHLVGN